MKNVIIKHFIFLLFGFLFSLTLYNTINAQDILTLKNSKKRLEVKLIDKSKKKFTFYKLEDEGGEIYELDRRFVAWYRPLLWIQKRISFSFSFGISPYGTANGIKKYMTENGYGGSVPSWFGGTVNYPKSMLKIPFMLEFEYNFKPPHGISIAYANTNSGSVRGTNNAPDVLFNNPQIILFYKYYLPAFRSNFQAGLIVNFATIDVIENIYSPNSINSESTKTSPGILIGYSGSIIEKNVFFMRINGQFKYVPPIEPEGLGGFLAKERIGLSNLYIGIQTGFKLYPGK